jgi:hypothetical protein
MYLTKLQTNKQTITQTKRKKKKEKQRKEGKNSD